MRHVQFVQIMVHYNKLYAVRELNAARHCSNPLQACYASRRRRRSAACAWCSSSRIAAMSCSPSTSAASTAASAARLSRSDASTSRLPSCSPQLSSTATCQVGWEAGKHQQAAACACQAVQQTYGAPQHANQSDSRAVLHCTCLGAHRCCRWAAPPPAGCGQRRQWRPARARLEPAPAAESHRRPQRRGCKCCRDVQGRQTDTVQAQRQHAELALIRRRTPSNVQGGPVRAAVDRRTDPERRRSTK